MELSLIDVKVWRRASDGFVVERQVRYEVLWWHSGIFVSYLRVRYGCVAECW